MGQHGQTHTRVCTKCNHLLPIGEFVRVGTNRYLRPECKACTAKLRRELVELKQEHGNAPDGYQCPVCLKNAEEAQIPSRTPFVIDHCHKTGKFRGWLCHRCNMALGQLQDDVEAAERAVNYLKEFNNENN